MPAAVALHLQVRLMAVPIPKQAAPVDLQRWLAKGSRQMRLQRCAGRQGKTAGQRQRDKQPLFVTFADRHPQGKVGCRLRHLWHFSKGGAVCANCLL